MVPPARRSMKYQFSVPLLNIVACVLRRRTCYGEAVRTFPRRAGAMLKDTIKKLRIQQGLSQDELAERVHVVRQTISKWERGTSVPDADSLMALARALGVSAAELLGESAMAEKEPRRSCVGDLSSGRARYQRVATARSPRALPQMGAHRRGGYGAGLRTFRLAAKPAVLICDMVGQRG